MPIWTSINERMLNQGDFLPKIDIPSVGGTFPVEDADGNTPLLIKQANVIVVSQSCDLEQRKIPQVVVAEVTSTEEFEKVNKSFAEKGKWKSVANGRFEALHLLASPEMPDDSKSCLVVDFRQIASLPIEYIESFAEGAGDRWRLQSPYLENLSQAFGRFFMRVALPRPHATF